MSEAQKKDAPTNPPTCGARTTSLSDGVDLRSTTDGRREVRRAGDHQTPHAEGVPMRECTSSGRAELWNDPAHYDPWCARCGHAMSDHPRGPCGATTGGDRRCDCQGFRKTPLPDEEWA